MVTFFIVGHAFRFWQEYLAREFEFTGLRINFNEFHFDFITDLQSIFNFFKAFPLDLGDMQQTILVRYS